jgi:formylglycine-generating enzyme required for sulfatase activity
MTEKESADGKLPRGTKYRLPTDGEWSRAAGRTRDGGETPKIRSERNVSGFPWGGEFPPRNAKVGNYADTAWHDKFPNEKWIEGYTDGYPTTAPVGSFAPNKHGIYDLWGNVGEWCEDLYDPRGTARVANGASWHASARNALLSSYRYPAPRRFATTTSAFVVCWVRPRTSEGMGFPLVWELCFG